MISPKAFFDFSVSIIALTTSSTCKKSLYCLPSEQGKVSPFRNELITIGINLLLSCLGPKT